jgi:hypothetical protein
MRMATWNLEWAKPGTNRHDLCIDVSRRRRQTSVEERLSYPHMKVGVDRSSDACHALGSKCLSGNHGAQPVLHHRQELFRDGEMTEGIVKRRNRHADFYLAWVCRTHQSLDKLVHPSRFRIADACALPV